MRLYTNDITGAEINRLLYTDGGFHEALPADGAIGAAVFIDRCTGCMAGAGRAPLAEGLFGSVFPLAAQQKIQNKENNPIK